jgi:hypothetical protein
MPNSPAQPVRPGMQDAWETYIDQWEARKSIGGTILMVLEHNVEHRPEVLHILQRLGLSDLPEVDYGVWDYLVHNT